MSGEYLLCYYVSVTLLGAGYLLVNKTDPVSAFMEHTV